MVIDFRLRPPFGGFLKVGMYADKAAADFYSRNIGMKRSASAREESMRLLLKEMDENGIDMGVATGRIGHRKGNVPNAEIVRLLEEYPGRFMGFAGLDAGDVNGSIEEIERYCVDGPLKGVVLEPGAMEKPMYADDGRLYPIYAACEKAGIPVQIMIGGRAGPDRSYSHPKIISRLAADFPGVNFIVAHGCWPFVQEILGVCFYQENIYLCPDLYFFNLPGQDDYIRAGNYYLQDRFLFASAYPFTPLSCVHEFRESFKPEVRDKLLYKNAAKLLGLD
ncbi:MAG: amidohydrolase [Desulfovibrio sp.]|uniref:amidohydrolase family protein n=1 Tax=Desulfovibrio sp. TaxID=885 RepID=UPI001A7DF70D|nr:amidohydrolase family protein [Desulfovibrio sp.]MBD5418086.1 amidohydrolase [Desulfovibrio sp.]